MNGSVVTIDTNEHSHHPEHFTEFISRGALCKVASLPYDFEIACADGAVLAVERKTPRDLLESLRDKRLFNQVADMVAKTRWNYLVCEGWLWPNRRGFTETSEHQMTAWSWASIQGALLSVQELGCAIVYDPDFHGAVDRIVSRSRSDIKIESRREPYVFSDKEQILMAMPGIGSKKAQIYLEKFNDNIALALTALTAPHNGKEYLTGWGKRSRDNLVEVLGGQLEIKIDE